MTAWQNYLGKAIWDTYNLGGWLILQALLKNWVAEGIASDVNDIVYGVFLGNVNKVLGKS